MMSNTNNLQNDPIHIKKNDLIPKFKGLFLPYIVHFKQFQMVVNISEYPHLFNIDEMMDIITGINGRLFLLYHDNNMSNEQLEQLALSANAEMLCDFLPKEIFKSGSFKNEEKIFSRLPLSDLKLNSGPISYEKKLAYVDQLTMKQKMELIVEMIHCVSYGFFFEANTKKELFNTYKKIKKSLLEYHIKINPLHVFDNNEYIDVLSLVSNRIIKIKEPANKDSIYSRFIISHLPVNVTDYFKDNIIGARSYVLACQFRALYNRESEEIEVFKEDGIDINKQLDIKVKESNISTDNLLFLKLTTVCMDGFENDTYLVNGGLATKDFSIFVSTLSNSSSIKQLFNEYLNKGDTYKIN